MISAKVSCPGLLVCRGASTSKVVGVAASVVASMVVKVGDMAQLA